MIEPYLTLIVNIHYVQCLMLPSVVHFFFLHMLSKSLLFCVMNLRMRILSPPPSLAAAVVGVVEGRRGAHITLRLPSLVAESSLLSPNGKVSKYDNILCHNFGICNQCMICVAFLLLFFLLLLLLLFLSVSCEYFNINRQS